MVDAANISARGGRFFAPQLVKVRAFLNDVAGLETTAVKANEGMFLITAASFEGWVASGPYEKFRGMFQ